MKCSGLGIGFEGNARKAGRNGLGRTRHASGAIIHSQSVNEQSSGKRVVVGVSLEI